MSGKIAGLLSQLKYTAWSALLRRDQLRPSCCIDNFNQLQIPENTKFIILDKDNCFAKPHALSVWPAFHPRWNELLALNGKKYEVVVLSNTAGDAQADPGGELARTLESNIGVRVLRHEEKKPMCYKELAGKLPCEPKDVLVVGDRLVTDVLLANLIGAKSVWIRPGLHMSVLNRIEMALYGNPK